jgi:hypothetical protein
MLYFSSLLKTPKYFSESNYTKTTFYTLVLDTFSSLDGIGSFNIA